MMRITLICCLLLFTFTLTRAQESTPEPADGWTIEQRCVAEPTTPPDDWTFDGTILMTGYAGIHAVSANFDTPYVVVFSNARWQFGAILSPDGRWIAVSEGENWFSETMCTGANIDTVHLYSTIQRDEQYTMAWDLNWGICHSGVRPDIYWFDNTHLLYPSRTMPGGLGFHYMLVNPFTGETEAWENSNIISAVSAHPSPDWTRTVYDNDSHWGRQEWALTTDGISNTLLPIYANVLWKPDSSQFAAFLGDNQATRLALFDRDGQMLETIYDVSLDIRPTLESWASDGRYFAFITDTLNIGDTQERRITDTCLNARHGTAWSSDNTQLAIIEPSRGQSPVRIIDLQNWEAYTLAYHSNGEIIGWRADD